MIYSRARRALVLSGATALVGCALVSAAPAHAYVGPGAFYPDEQQPLYPGTDTPIHGWQLVGTGGYFENPGDTDPQGGASQLQLSERFVLGSEHAGIRKPGWFAPPVRTGVVVDPTKGTGVEVDATFHPNQFAIQERDSQGGGNTSTDGGPYEADARLAHLPADLAAPPGGFPKLLRDWVGPDLASVLPGYVLWAGQGKIDKHGAPRVGWTTPNGRNAPGHGRVDLADGDSGSTGLWYTSETARPVVTSVITTPPLGVLTLGETLRYANRLAPGGDGFATLADFLDAQFAKYPAAERPEWTTLAQEGIDFDELLPPAPRRVRVQAASPTSLELAWDHSKEDRVARQRYLVTVSPGDRTISVDRDAESVLIDGLTVGVAYTVKVVAKNANGVSPPATKRSGMPYFDERSGVSDADLLEPQAITHTLGPDPTSVVTDVTAATAAANAIGANGSTPKLDYCANISWQMPVAPAGEQIDGLSVYFGSDEITLRPPGVNPRVGLYGVTDTQYEVRDGRGNYRICGLVPSKTYSALVMTRWQRQFGPAVFRTVRTPAGSPAGTVLGKATDVRVAAYRQITAEGTADYCVRVSWAAPPALIGLAQRYTIKGAIGDLPVETAGPIEAREFVRCGLAAGADGVVQVWTLHGALSAGRPPTESVSTLQGAPAGTPVPRPTNLRLSARPADAGGAVDYCIDASWTVDPLDGFTSGDVVGAAPVGASGEHEAGVIAMGTSRTSAICGLQPGTTYDVFAGLAYAVSSLQTFSAAARITTPTGAAPGTLWAAPRGLTVTQQMVGGQRCATVAWDPPVPVAGFPVTRYTAYVASESTGYSAIALSLGSAVRNKQFCGLPASLPLTATVQASYRMGISSGATLEFVSAA